MKLHVRYFASLREASGRDAETLSHEGGLPELFTRLRDRDAWRWRPEQLRVAVNGEIVAWDTSLNESDEVVFLPPVSGG